MVLRNSLGGLYMQLRVQVKQTVWKLTPPPTPAPSSPKSCSPSACRGRFPALLLCRSALPLGRVWLVRLAGGLSLPAIMGSAQGPPSRPGSGRSVSATWGSLLAGGLGPSVGRPIRAGLGLTASGTAARAAGRQVSSAANWILGSQAADLPAEAAASLRHGGASGREVPGCPAKARSLGRKSRPPHAALLPEVWGVQPATLPPPRDGPFSFRRGGWVTVVLVSPCQPAAHRRDGGSHGAEQEERAPRRGHVELGGRG